MNRNPARPPGAPPALRLTPPRSTLPGAPDGHTAFFASLLDRFGTTPELADPGRPPHMGGGAAERDPAAAPHGIGNGPIAPSDLYPPPRRKPAALLLPFWLILALISPAVITGLFSLVAMIVDQVAGR